MPLLDDRLSSLLFPSCRPVTSAIVVVVPAVVAIVVIGASTRSPTLHLRCHHRRDYYCNPALGSSPRLDIPLAPEMDGKKGVATLMSPITGVSIIACLTGLVNSMNEKRIPLDRWKGEQESCATSAPDATSCLVYELAERRQLIEFAACKKPFVADKAVVFERGREREKRAERDRHSRRQK